jgi:hypothetical protein
MPPISSECRLEEAEHLQPGRANNLQGPPFEHGLEYQPLETGSVLDDDLVQIRHPVRNDLEAAGHDSKARRGSVTHGKREDLQLRTVLEQGFKIFVFDDAVEEAEFAELVQRGRARGGDLGEVPHAGVETLEGGAAEEQVVGERHVERPRVVEEDEILDLLGGEGRDQALERELVEVEGDAGEAHTADGARVPVDAARHGAHDGDVAGPFVAHEVGVVDHERGRGPHAAPARGEGDGARGFLGREAGDDFGEERVRESADVVLAVARRRRGERGPGGTHAGVGGGAVVVGVAVSLPARGRGEGGGRR